MARYRFLRCKINGSLGVLSKIFPYAICKLSRLRDFSVGLKPSRTSNVIVCFLARSSIVSGLGFIVLLFIYCGFNQSCETFREAALFLK